MKLTKKSCLVAPLCCLLPLTLVRPILKVDVQLLQNEFANGYCEGDESPMCLLWTTMTKWRRSLNILIMVGTLVKRQSNESFDFFVVR